MKFGETAPHARGSFYVLFRLAEKRILLYTVRTSYR